MNSFSKKALLLSACMISGVSGFSGVSKADPSMDQSASGSGGQPYFYYGEATSTARTAPTYTPAAVIEPVAAAEPVVYTEPVAATASTPSSYPSNAGGALPGYEAATGYFEPINDRIISDPEYLPFAHQFYATTSYDWSTNHSKGYAPTGVQSAKDFTWNNGLDQTLSYGLTDQLSLNVSESFHVSGSAYGNYTNHTKTDVYDNGFTDPSFGVAYRAIDQRLGNPGSLDVRFNFAPDMMDASEGGGGHTGAEAQGGNLATLTMDAGRVMRNFTIFGSLGANYYSDSGYEQLSTDDMFKRTSYFSYVAQINTQTRFTERCSANLNFQYHEFGTYSLTNATTGARSNNGIANYAEFVGTLNYHFIPNKLVGQISYGLEVPTTNAYYNVANPTSDVTTKYGNDSDLTVRLLYTF